MKTKLYKLADVQPILCEVDKFRIPSVEDIEKKILKTLTIGFTNYVPLAKGDPICYGDKVMIRITSVLPKFNKEKISITVGSRLYDETIEDTLVGMYIGETSTVITNGESAMFTIISANRISYPELTDEMVKNQNIDGIYTVEEYSDYVLGIEQRAVVGDIVDEIVEQLIGCSEVSSIDWDDISMSLQMFYESIRQHYLLIHVDVDELPSEDWPKVFGVQNKSELFKGMLFYGAEKVIPICLIYCALLGKPCEGEYDPTINGHAEAILRKELVEKYLRIFIEEE